LKIFTRKTKFTLGILLAILPFAVWMAVPAAFFMKTAISLHMDVRLFAAYAFMLAVISETAAICFLERSRQKPRDGLSICSLTGVILSGLAIVVFIFAIVGATLQGS
jgi:nitrate reductase gamma subunit